MQDKAKSRVILSPHIVRAIQELLVWFEYLYLEISYLKANDTKFYSQFGACKSSSLKSLNSNTQTILKVVG